MPDCGPAPAYKGILALHKLYGKALPDGECDLAAMRSRTSAWIRNWRLEQPEIHEEFDSAGRWRCFSAAPATRNHIFYVHGGGLVYYSTEDYKSLLSHIAHNSTSIVTAFEYPPAPEATFDQIVEHVTESIERRHAQLAPGSKLTLCGDSVGGYICLLVALQRSPERFAKVVLIYPVLDAVRQRSSYASYADGYPLTAANMSWFQELMRSGTRGCDLDLFALSAAQLGQLPPLHVFSAEFDVLRDDAVEWVAYLRRQGVVVGHRHFDRLCHDFCLYAGKVAEARVAIDALAEQLGC